MLCTQKIVFQDSTMVQLDAQPPFYRECSGSRSLETEFASSHTCAAFLQVLQVPPTVQKRALWLNWIT